MPIQVPLEVSGSWLERLSLETEFSLESLDMSLPGLGRRQRYESEELQPGVGSRELWLGHCRDKHSQQEQHSHLHYTNTLRLYTSTVLRSYFRID